jgi:zinc transport system substrate-binding protein
MQIIRNKKGNYMKKIASVLILLVTTILLVSCGNDKTADIVTTMFPQYDFAKQIVGDKMTVSLLIPAGAEIHDFEPTSKDMVMIREAKLFIFTSLELDQWIGSLGKIGGDNTVVLNLSETFVLADHDHSGHGNHDSEHLDDHDDHDDAHLDDHDHDDHDDAHLDDHDHDHDHDHNDLHYWVDPTTALQLIDAILEQIVLIDPENEDFYRLNAANYKDIIEEIHHEIDEFFSNDLYKDSTIYFAGHNAMGAFAERYHLNIATLYESFQPDADLTSAEFIAFINAVRNSGTSYLFIEELAEPKAAEKIVAEFKNYDITLLELHGFHNISKKDMEDGVTYAILLARNLEFLKLALMVTSNT